MKINWGNFDWMLTWLVVGVIVIGLSFWKAQKREDFNLLDMLMENGKVSRIAFWYMVSGAVSTWVVIDLQIKGKLDGTMFGLWLTAWVGPLIAKLVFGKNDFPAPGTIVTNTTSSTTEVKPSEPQ